MHSTAKTPALTDRVHIVYWAPHQAQAIQMGYQLQICTPRDKP
jgi:hypothetical protein